jgi:hypothetical protein
MPLPIGLQTVTELDLRLAFGCEIRPQLPAWDALTILRLMLLPCIRTVSVTNIMDRQIWSEDVLNATPGLYGTSRVTKLLLGLLAIEVAQVIHDLIRVPKTLELFECRHVPITTLDITGIGQALVESSYRTSLETMTIGYPNVEMADSILAASPILGTHNSLKALPSLRTIDIPALSSQPMSKL